MTNETELSGNSGQFLELKPCPFDGMKPFLNHHPTANGAYVYRVCCPDCGVGMAINTDRQDAINLWNRRANTELQENYEKLLSIVKDVVRILNHIEIQPSSAMHHCARKLLRELEEKK